MIIDVTWKYRNGSYIFTTKHMSGSNNLSPFFVPRIGEYVEIDKPDYSGVMSGAVLDVIRRYNNECDLTHITIILSSPDVTVKRI